MFAFSLLSSSRDLVNKHFKTNFITLLILGLGIFVSFQIDSFTQPMTTSLAHNFQQSVLQPLGIDLQMAMVHINPEQLSALSSLVTNFLDQHSVRKSLIALLLIGLGTTILGSLLELGQISMGLEITGNTEQKSWKGFFSGRNNLWLYWGTTFIQWVCIILGLICFILPGIYIACRLALANYILLAEDVSISQALHKSRTITNGHSFLIFKTSILLALAQLIGMLAMGVGLLWTYPMTWITWGKLYTMLKK